MTVKEKYPKFSKIKYNIKVDNIKQNFFHLIFATNTSPLVLFYCSHINDNYTIIKISLAEVLKSNF